MRQELGMVLSAAVLAVALPQAARAAEGQAPPTLTPVAARQAAAACPGAKRFADALVRGISRADAVAATPVLERCATQIRFAEERWKNDAAQLALAADELSRGLLDKDAAMLRRAADATADQRAQSRASDAEIRDWTVIPDYYDPIRRELVVLENPYGCIPAPADNAAYINVAARAGTAWITMPRSTPTSALPFNTCRSAPVATAAEPSRPGRYYPVPTVVLPVLQESERRPGGR